MVEVGVRELKNSLSSYLKRVRQGETVVVTDRGVQIAQVIPVGIPEHTASLMAEGRVSWSGKKFVSPPKVPHLTPGPPLSDYIAEDRG